MNEPKSIGRAFDLLFTLAEYDTPPSVETLARHVGIPVSTTYRLLQALEQRGLLQRQQQHKIVLGSACLMLSRAMLRQAESNFIEVARPLMRQLSQQTGESVVLCALLGKNGICLESISTHKAIRYMQEQGDVFPLYASASGAALLAHLDPHSIQDVIRESSGKAYAHGGPVTPQHLEEKIAHVRRHGYVVTHSELDAGATGVSAPIFGAAGQFLAVLTVAGPTERCAGDALPGLIAQLRTTVRLIQNRLIEAPAGS